MSTRPLILGQTAGGVDLPLAVDRLIGSNLGIAAQAGAGKSRTVRKLLELTHGRLQHIVLDSEDEFYTLRESFDYVIAGGENGDCPATVDNAAALAIAILENGLSTIVQLNGLGRDGARAFVDRFARALIEAPQALWHPLLVVLDEAHRFAPQDAKVESSDAVHDLASMGRKRGFTLVFATQRLSKIDKDVTSDAPNWMLGRVGQGVDRRAVADALGFAPSSAEGRGLQALETGSFWVQGPALATAPTLIHVGPVSTTHMQAGQGRAPTPPAPKKLRSILDGLAALAKPTTVADQKTGSGETQADLSRSGARQTEPADRPASADEIAAAERRGYEKGYDQGVRDAASWVAPPLAQIGDALGGALKKVKEELAILNRRWSGQESIAVEEIPAGPPARLDRPGEAPLHAPKPVRAQPVPEAGGTDTHTAQRLSASAARLLDTIERSAGSFSSWADIAMLSVLSPTGGNFNAARKQLLDTGAVVQIEGVITAPALPVDPAPLDRAAILQAWRDKLGGSAARILTHLSLSSPATWGEVSTALGLSPTGGNWNAARKMLRANGLVVADGNAVSLNPLFETHTRRVRQERG